MKTFIIVWASVFLLSACGGGGTVENGGGDDGGGAPTITAIAGTGSSGEVLDSLAVTGTNFVDAPDMLVYLVGAASTMALDFVLESSEQFTATLPESIEPGDFELQIETPSGDTSAPLSLLRGETGATGATGATGPQGPQGEDGADGTDGITYAASWECDASSDLDPDVQIVMNGTKATVYQFSDGSYFLFCMDYYEDGSGPIIDTSTGVSFTTADQILGIGYADAKPFWVGCQFDPSETQLTWYVIAEPTTNETVACTPL